MTRQVDAQHQDIDTFIRELFRHGVHVLPCGGGVIAEPRWAIWILGGTYGEDQLRRMCYRVYTLPRDVPERDLPEGVGRTVCGILYHLGNDELLEELVCLYRRQVEARDPSVTDPEQYWMGSSETLIAGICNRLGRPLPDGIRPLLYQDEVEFFSPDDEPSTWRLCLSVILAPVFLLAFALQWLKDSLHEVVSRCCAHRKT